MWQTLSSTITRMSMERITISYNDIYFGVNRGKIMSSNEEGMLESSFEEESSKYDSYDSLEDEKDKVYGEYEDPLWLVVKLTKREMSHHHKVLRESYKSQFSSI
ncbi:hypothetical protein SESBI_24330 [Sesbania bispinosa]|nr:hypothetical protein SESBI_24330 [Sesbania bispinosa]